MTSNERKILKYLWDAKGRAHVRVISENVGITTDYTRLLCRSLARSGHIKFADASICYLLTRGRNCFQREEKKAEPQEINKTEAKPADNPASATLLPVRRSPRPAEAFGESQVGEGGKSPEKAVPKKEGSAKPSGGFGISFKKIVNWFAKKK